MSMTLGPTEPSCVGSSTTLLPTVIELTIALMFKPMFGRPMSDGSGETPQVGPARSPAHDGGYPKYVAVRNPFDKGGQGMAGLPPQAIMLAPENRSIFQEFP